MLYRPPFSLFGDINFLHLGTATVHEVIRGFGTLLRAGWKPLRTIVFASWDAEEVYMRIPSLELVRELIGPTTVRPNREH